MKMKQKMRNGEIDATCMRNEVEQVPEPSEQDKVDSHFGGCSECGLHDGYCNVGPRHWFMCIEHKVRWLGGVNLFGDWRQESHKDWKANEELLADYEIIVPVFRFTELEQRRLTPATHLSVRHTRTDHSLDIATACIRYHSGVDGALEGWAQACGRDPEELRSASEMAIRSRHHDSIVEAGHEADDQRPDVFTLTFDNLQVFYSLEGGHVLIRGYGYEADGEPADDFEGGGFFS